MFSTISANNARDKLAILALSCCCIAMAGCSVIDSKNQDIAADKPVNGMTYFLPTRDVQLTANRKVVKDADLKKALAGQQKALKDFEGLSAEKRKQIAELQKKLSTLDTDKTVGEDSKKKINKQLDIAKAEKKIADDSAKAKKSEIARTEALLALQTVNNCPKFAYDFKIERLAARPDPEFIFTANPSHSALRDDTTKLRTTVEGFLTTSNAVAADRSGDILVEIAGAVGAFAGAPGPSPFFAMATAQPAGAVCPVPKPYTISYTRVFDPTDPTIVVDINRILNSSLQFPFLLSVDPIARKSGPSRQTKPFEQFDGLAYRRALPYVITINRTIDPPDPGLISGANRIIADLEILGEEASRLADADNFSTGEIRQLEDGIDGLSKIVTALDVMYPSNRLQGDAAILSAIKASLQPVSTPSPQSTQTLKQAAGTITRIADRIASIQKRGNTFKTPIKSTLVMLPNKGPISYIPFRSSAFVKTVNDVEFKDGSVVKWDNERPSEVLEVVRLPVRILKALISVPTEIFQLKVNYSNAQTNLIEAQQQQIEADQKLKALQACLERVETGIGTVGDCTSS